MNKEDSKMLENAMQAAIVAKGKGESIIDSLPPELMGLVMRVLPKLLENVSEREDLVEIQKESGAALNEEISAVSRRIGKLSQATKAIVETQKGVLEELRLMRELQSTIVGHLARVQIIDMPDDDEFEEVDEHEDDFSDGVVSDLSKRRWSEAAPAKTRKRAGNSRSR